VNKDCAGWFEHVERMNTDRLPLTALHTKIKGKRRKRSRHRKRL